MSIKKVKDYFKQYEMDTRIQEFSVSSATVDLAASALGCEPERIAKTLSFLVNGQAILVVTSGDAKVDNKKFKEYFKTKAKMLPPHEVVDLVGHEIGGVCPFAIKNGVSVYLDMSLKRFETVYPACGSSNSAIELTINQLEKHSGYSQWIDVCKGWNDEFTQ
ncbi:YbaK/EbsC family protein [Bacillus altitudinis]|uniref:Putative tRNA editing enzyme n=1 Tax=Bacillus altitudinis TaxID=293387 RepID=A0A653MCB5_BACAB|nr:YbaK/EbsC family protein [Bacillus altitudinis]MDM5165752.1 YbaK/EbsC family protein [Bacillus altitudinis]QOV50284.1 YbaK/EbsC family protein [Bacillus altitudinis]RAU01450.1 EBSC protein [Bacillus altitudinis]VXB01936.1 putative tRNA editing enzyme [Bacillus altitudinis]